jgi:hypothetical protein
MPEDGQYDQNMQHVLTGLIKFVVVDGNMYLSFNKYCHFQHLPDYKKRENGAAQWRCAGVFYSKDICLWLQCRS